MISSKIDIVTKAGALATGVNHVKHKAKSAKAYAIVIDVSPSASTSVEISLEKESKKNASEGEVASPLIPNLKCLKKDKDEEVYTEFDLQDYVTGAEEVYELAPLYDTVNGTEFIIEFDSSVLDGNTDQFGGSVSFSVGAKTDEAAVGSVTILEDGKQLRPVTKIDN